MSRQQEILIVDDEPNIVAALEFLLARGGYQVRVANSGEEALRQIERSEPALVLLDVMMPRMSGYEVCRQLRERPEWRSIKVVMLSAKGGETDIGKGFSSGADLYVTKPFSTTELVAKVAEMLPPTA